MTRYSFCTRMATVSIYIAHFRPPKTHSMATVSVSIQAHHLLQILYTLLSYQATGLRKECFFYLYLLMIKERGLFVAHLLQNAALVTAPLRPLIKATPIANQSGSFSLIGSGGIRIDLGQMKCRLGNS
jgi:hypothetical protein